jgi:hypothetical protein
VLGLRLLVGVAGLDAQVQPALSFLVLQHRAVGTTQGVGALREAAIRGPAQRLVSTGPK